MGFWLVLSGHYTLLLISLGVVSCVVVTWRNLHMDSLDGDLLPLGAAFRVGLYLPWLLKEIFLSNIRVARLILARQPRLDPVLVRVRASQRTDFGRFVHANSITLTPGTVTVATSGNHFDVHVLSAPDAPPNEGGAMDGRVRRLEGSGAHGGFVGGNGGGRASAGGG